MVSDKRTVLIPAAGQSARFAAHGWTGPKALRRIRFRGHPERSMIQMILDSMPAWAAPVIIVRGGDYPMFMDEVRNHRSRPSVVGLGAPSLGQSITVQLGLNAVLPRMRTHEPVIVHNCDVIFWEQVICNIDQSDTECHVAVNHDTRPKTEPPIYSYVDSRYIPTRIAEKERISDWAVSGLWRFASADRLNHAIDQQIIQGDLTNGEYYLSGAIGRLHGDMSCLPLTGQHMMDLGTPESITAIGGEIVG